MESKNKTIDGKVNKIKEIVVKNIWFIILIALVLMTNFLILYHFFAKHYIYAFRGWGYDTYHQFVPELHLVFRKFCEGTSFYSFQDGLGTDLISIAKWVTDPFTLIIILISIVLGDINRIEELMVLLPVMVSLASGIVGYLYLRRYVERDYAACIGAYMYAMCGYLYTTGTHYWFTSLLFFYPLVLLGIDHFLYQKKQWLLIISVFFVATRGAYGAFAVLVAAAVYYIFNSLAAGKKVKDTAVQWLRMVAFVVLGLLLSMFSFLPNVYEILCISGRVDGGSLTDKLASAFTLISSKEAIAAFLRLFSVNMQGMTDHWQGTHAWFSCFPMYFSILFVLIVPQWFYYIHHSAPKEKRARYIVGSVIVIIALFTNIFSRLFNMFAYNEWRMIYVVLPFFGMISAITIENMISKKVFSHTLNIACTVAFIILLNWLNESGAILEPYVYKRSIIFLIIFSLALEVICIKKQQIPQIAALAMLVLLAANFCYEYRYAIYCGFSLIEYDDQKNYYTDPLVQNCLQYTEELEGENFYRIERTAMGKSSDACWSYVMPARSMSMYNSLLDDNIKQYLHQMVQTPMNSGMDIEYLYCIGDYGALFDSVRLTTLGLKYVISGKKHTAQGWTKVLTTEGGQLYRNEGMDSCGVVYDQYITTTDYAGMSAVQKQCVEASAVIIDENDADLFSFAERANAHNETMSKQIAYVNYEASGCEVTEDNGSLSINHTTSDSLVLHYDSSMFSAQERKVLVLKQMNVTGNYHISSVDKNGEMEKLILVRSEGESAAIIPDDCSDVVIVFDADGTTVFDQIDMVSVPAQYSQMVHFDNPGMENIVEGTVKAETEGILYMPIPYRDGWKVYINGTEGQIGKANYAFMAVPVPAGENHICFEYHNPVLGIGIALSMAGMLVFIIYVLCVLRRKKNKATA